MSLFSLQAKRKQQSEATLVSDLDAMVAKPVAFRLHGRIHEIKPISLEEFYKFANAWTTVLNWKDSDGISPKEYLKGLTELFQSVCDSITEDDVLRLTQAQAGALFQLIIESVTGKAQVEPVVSDGEKKN